MSEKVKKQIQALIDRETLGLNTKNPDGHGLAVATHISRPRPLLERGAPRVVATGGGGRGLMVNCST